MDSGDSDARDEDSNDDDDDDDDFADDLSVCGDRYDGSSDADGEAAIDGADEAYHAVLSQPAKSDCAARRRFSTRRLSSLARHSADPAVLALGTSFFIPIRFGSRTHGAAHMAPQSIIIGRTLARLLGCVAGIAA